jgi:mannose-6-phosphate isomerase-like protein (cupin superfamily)
MTTTYKPSPRPTFDAPAAIPYGAVTRHLWGDEDAGEVADWIYVSSDRIHQLVYALPPGGSFRHSDEFRTVFAADVVYYVLSGVLVIANPGTGEVQRLEPGEAAFFRRDTWHHAFNYSTDPLRVLEFFAPPPSQGTSGAYARAQPLLEETRYSRDGSLGNWPESAPAGLPIAPSTLSAPTTSSGSCRAGSIPCWWVCSFRPNTSPSGGSNSCRARNRKSSATAATNRCMSCPAPSTSGNWAIQGPAGSN